jgi:exonuclease III
VRSLGRDGRKADVVGVKIASWNVGSLSKKSGEVVEVLMKRRVDVCCIQEARWKGEGARLIGRHDAEYKIYWKGGKESTAGVAVLVAEWLVYKVV